MKFRVVPDTNVLVAARRSTSPTSPNREILQRWQAGELTLLYTSGMLDEYAEKLTELTSLPDSEVVRFLAIIIHLGESIEIESYHFPIYPKDPDDIPFFLCAVNGDATHLVTYDPHFDPIRHQYGFAVVSPVEFLQELRESNS